MNRTFTCSIKAGRYFVGDPGRAMRMGLFQEAGRQMDGCRMGAAHFPDGIAVMMEPDSGRITYPAAAGLGEFECVSGMMGIVAETLTVADHDRSLSCDGAWIIVLGKAMVHIEDGTIKVVEGARTLLHLETARPRTEALPLAA